MNEPTEQRLHPVRIILIIVALAVLAVLPITAALHVNSLEADAAARAASTTP